MSDGYRSRSRNTILVKDDVGRAKHTCYDLPHEGHAYGRAEPADMEGAREVTMHWAAHVPRPKPRPDCQDFRKINKMATKDGISNPKTLAAYKKTKDVKLLPAGPAGALPTVIPSDVIPSFAYGKKSRPSTPIAAVVSHQYQAECEEALESTYRQYEEIRDNSVRPLRVGLTKTASRQIANARSAKSLMPHEQEPRELFKLTKFKKVPSRLGLGSEPGMQKSSSLPAIVTQKVEYGGDDMED